MDITYRVMGSDGKEYGPVTQQQLQSWISDGRILGETQVSRSDDGPWRQANQFVELVWPTSAAAPQAAAAPPAAAMAGLDTGVAVALERQMRSGASWFYWIAGLSAVNSISALSGSTWRFVIGLSITQVFDVIGRELGGTAIVLVLDIVVLGIFVLLGIFAHKRQLWAFIVGMVLYGLDAVLSLIFQDWINLAFHAFALWGLFSGVKAAAALNRLSRAA